MKPHLAQIKKKKLFGRPKKNLSKFFDKVETDIIGSDSISNSTDSVDNKKLIEINETIRYHSIEIIGDELRQYMTSMKTAI